ncbi:MAG: signal peptidase I [Lachnospiraceae bacterium]|nr:signal peptidase I [Lachnospiraceae bacterium]
MRRRRFLERYNGYKLEWLNDSLFFIVLIAAVFVLFRFVIGLSVIGGDSMSPHLTDGEVVVYSRLDRHYKPGDVISMRVPSGEFYVKRVIAVGGDVVDLRSGSVYVNDELLSDSWGVGDTKEEYGAVIYPYTVREGNVFVLGDNRVVSMDSRTFGEVNLRQIKGKIMLQIGRWYIRRVFAAS